MGNDKLNLSIIEKKPQILFWDIESSTIDIVYETYGLSVYTKRFNPKDIQRDWNIYCIAYAFNDDEPKCIGVSPKNPLNDYEVVRSFREILDRADYIVGHNMDRFDLKKFNTRLAYYNLPPVGKKYSYDTLKAVRRVYDLTSNKLSYACSFFGLTHKEESPDWKKVREGCPIEHANMRRYCKGDVIASRDLYNKVKKYDPSHPDLNVKSPVIDVKGKKVEGICPACLSSDTYRDGSIYLRTTKRQQWSCKSCGHKFKGGHVKI